ncbi:hypothetical protein HX836_20790 [Pseudomonas yamanorum]|uniref:hypothetical protein n=1 Tax=Pseudomonas yamanorum TaxID=515393 RepID=UPI0015A07AB3|nr:hypothetical protein [Pseudomonas yamanorum]NVZ84256.1 hypothetical protein [Pseudomonas yamanorum]
MSIEKQSIYMPNDKAICDAVNSSKVSSQSLSEIFFKRGIIVSPKTDRDELALYYSRMFTGYRDYDELTSNLQSITQREKTTSRFITNTNTDEMLQAVNQLKNIINAKEYPKDASAVISKYSNEIKLTITYTDINPNKSQLQQTVTKESTIVITEDKGELTLRSPYNEDSEKWVNHLFEILSKDKAIPPKIETISLEFLDDPKLRSQFLEELIKAIKGYSLKDVSKVSVFNPEKTDKTSGNPDGLDTETEDIDSGTHVFRASLNGKGVLNSKEVDLLHEKGFYTSHVVWTCTEDSATPDIYEIEIKFEDAERCNQFSQKVKGFYRYMSLEKYSTNRFPPSGTIERDIHTKIETTARTLISTFMQAALPSKIEVEAERA